MITSESSCGMCNAIITFSQQFYIFKLTQWLTIENKPNSPPKPLDSPRETINPKSWGGLFGHFFQN